MHFDPLTAPADAFPSLDAYLEALPERRAYEAAIAAGRRYWRAHPDNPVWIEDQRMLEAFWARMHAQEHPIPVPLKPVHWSQQPSADPVKRERRLRRIIWRTWASARRAASRAAERPRNQGLAEEASRLRELAEATERECWEEISRIVNPIS